MPANLLTKLTSAHIFPKSIVGTKALRIAQLSQLKIETPQGFVFTSDAFKEFIAPCKIELENAYFDHLSDREYSRPISRLTQQIHQILSRQTFSDQLIKQILNFYESINQNSTVCIRYSLTDENLPHPSKHFRSIQGDNNLLESLKQSIINYFSNDLNKYLCQKKISFQTINLALIVQSEITCQSSGFFYSSHPDQKLKKTHCLIKAAYGNSENFSQLRDQADEYTVDLTTKNISNSLKRTQSLYFLPFGEKPKKVADNLADQAKLSHAQILKLVSTAQKITQYYFFAQKIEWGFTPQGQLLIFETSTQDLDPTPKSTNHLAIEYLPIDQSVQEHQKKEYQLIDTNSMLEISQAKNKHLLVNSLDSSWQEVKNEYPHLPSLSQIKLYVKNLKSQLDFQLNQLSPQSILFRLPDYQDLIGYPQLLKSILDEHRHLKNQGFEGPILLSNINSLEELLLLTSRILYDSPDLKDRLYLNIQTIEVALDINHYLNRMSGILIDLSELYESSHSRKIPQTQSLISYPPGLKKLINQIITIGHTNQIEVILEDLRREVLIEKDFPSENRVSQALV